jgi:hypothetical protein
MKKWNGHAWVQGALRYGVWAPLYHPALAWFFHLDNLSDLTKEDFRATLDFA